MRSGDLVENDAQVLIADAKLVGTWTQRFVIEKAHHHFFAQHRRERGDAHIKGRFADHNADTAVLRAAAFGDVHSGHDLDSGDHRRVQFERHPGLLVQNAVDAGAHQHAFFGRLEMDIGCALLLALLQDVVDHERNVRGKRLIEQ